MVRGARKRFERFQGGQYGYRYRVVFFHAKGGFFFVGEGGGPDVFVHVSAVERAGMTGLVEGQKLSFDIEADRRSGKSAAANLQAA